ncbi:hypothetical protein LQE92_09685 [Lacrimispora sp. NSJ-141]|uniref:X-X-X-Leu-X-X-Gly heptad repeats n=1 Tax=Lientehia hominis TaxID=2897778 RepID=A0AAP2W7Y6_9FIRM|nr:hypothetical protein [Lientehia hominis]MCD2492898.1 hypothetical protein [Lientehia hominis]
MTKKRRLFKRVLFSCLAVCLAVILAGLGTLGGGTDRDRSMAAEAGSGKETEKQGGGAAKVQGKDEVIYASLEAGGALKGIYVVNCLEVAEGGTIQDYGAYSQILNLTDTSEMKYKYGIVSAEAEAGRFYYQGNVEEGSLPWDISITYRLDGREVTAEEAAGQNGRLEISILTKPNGSGSLFYENYLLQISLTLDTSVCRNIEAEDASIADAGENKQITFTALPGKEGSFSVGADVSGFRMNGMSIAAVPFSMAFDLPDMSSMTEQLGELSDGIASLNEGTEELKEGAASLAEGAGALKEGSASYKDGLENLGSGITGLKNGGSQLGGGLSMLNAGALGLNSGMEDYWTGLSEFVSGLSQMKEGSGEYRSGIESVAGQSGNLTEGSQAVKDGLASMAEQLAGKLGSLAEESGQTGEGLGAGAAAGNGNALEQLAALPDALRGFADGLAGIKSGITGLSGNYGTMFTNLDKVITAIPEIDETALAGLGTDNETVNQLVASYRAAQTVKQTYIQMKEGLVSVQSSMDDMADALSSIETALRDTADQIEEALKGMDLSSIMDALKELNGGIAELSARYGEFHQGLLDYTEGVELLSQSYGSLDDGILDAVSGGNSLKDGFGELQSGAGGLSEGLSSTAKGFDSLMDGIGSLAEGTGALLDGYGQVDSGIGEIASGTDGVSEGMAGLQDGTRKMHLETKDIPEKIQEEIDKLLEDYDKSDFRPESFVSEKNQNVELVQFVISTDPIEKEEIEEPKTEEEETKTPWDRFLNLFRK